MTDMYEDPKAMEADGNLKPFPHEERGSEVCENRAIFSLDCSTRSFSTNSTQSTRLTMLSHVIINLTLLMVVSLVHYREEGQRIL
jgi:hypothetical protein